MKAGNGRTGRLSRNGPVCGGQAEPVRKSSEKVLPRALVIDHDGVMLRLVARMIDGLGYRVDMAENIEGINKLAACRYELALIDLEMPSMNGYRLSVWLKSEAPHTKVVIMTRCDRDEVIGLMLSGLIDAWLFKPFGVGDLRFAIQN